MKYIIKSIFVFAFLITSSCYANPCSSDVEEMYSEIAKYESITTKACPFNSTGWGITKVKNAIAVGQQTCVGTCYYAHGYGSNGVKCLWQRKNWGNTLGCYY